MLNVAKNLLLCLSTSEYANAAARLTVYQVLIKNHRGPALVTHRVTHESPRLTQVVTLLRMFAMLFTELTTQTKSHDRAVLESPQV